MTEDGMVRTPPEATTVGALVQDLTERLTAANVALAREEARDLVATLLDVPRFWPTTHRDAGVEPNVVDAARRAATRRASGAPFAYAAGRAAFRHLVLDVDERVLIPRQETEVLIDEVLTAIGPRMGGVAIDVGTGSGAIALALASEGPFERVIATDVSVDALAVARQNASVVAGALRSTVEFRQGSYLAPVQDVVARCVVSNPPYIAFDEAATLPSSVRDWEPALALYSGHDGMTAIATIVKQAGAVLERGGLLALEVDARRASLAAELVAIDGRYRGVRVRLDLAGRERFVLAVKQ